MSLRALIVELIDEATRETIASKFGDHVIKSAQQNAEALRKMIDGECRQSLSHKPRREFPDVDLRRERELDDLDKFMRRRPKGRLGSAV